tara:strand:+ start:709 stop:1092 length:384 start_codon:yes stop_codon:yes gene_type:complete
MIESLVKPVSNLIGKFVKDKDLQAQLDHELSTLFHKANLAQIEVNKIEAQGKPFQRNWRPSVGWICSFALGYHFILSPIIEVIIKVSGVQIDMPEFDFSQLSAILMALLGMSGLRSYDKMKKTDTKK